MDKGYITERTPLAGSSAGAIICAVIASGNTMQDALQVTKDLADNCRSKGTAFRLGAVLRDVLEKFLPDDLHIRCNGRIRVAITQLSWRPRGLLVDQFDSREDVINAVITSSFIPGYLAPRPATFFRNRLCIDGALHCLCHPLLLPKLSEYVLFQPADWVCKGLALVQTAIQRTGLVQDSCLTGRWNLRKMKFLTKLYELGYKDAAVWAEQNSTECIAKNDQPLAVD